MRFPDDVTVLRPVGADAYGNPGANFDAPEEIPTKGFHVVKGTLLLLPPTADVQDGDRFRIGDDTYAGVINPARSTTALKLYSVTLSRVED
jgi:hypothetical protein